LKYQLPISFVQLQELLVGNVINEQTLKMPNKIENDYKVFEENTKEYTKNVYINLKNYTVDKIGLKDRMTQREVLLNFANYAEVKGKLFSRDRNIEINTHHEKSSIQLQFSKFIFDKELEFPFSIPEKYEITAF
jgi:predicted metalloenzyme YecM